MANDGIEIEGIVVEVLPGGKYRVHLPEMDMEVTAYAAGKMKKNRIRIITGDMVTVELNTYEPTKGRIVYRTINKTMKKKGSGNDIVDIDTIFAVSIDTTKDQPDELDM